MSQFVKSFSKPFVSAADLSGSKYLAAKLDSNGKIDIATANTDVLMGVIEEGAQAYSGASVSVQILGTAKMIAGGTISVGARVTPTTAGKVIATTTDKQGSVGIYIGTAAAASGDIIEVFLTPGVYLSV